MLIFGGGVAQSPLLTVTAARDVVVRTAQTRLYLETSVATALAGLLSVRIPLYIELAAGEAKLADINCTQEALRRGVTLSVTPSIGTVALADVDTQALTNFAHPANPRPALLAQTVGTRVTAQTVIALGGVQPQTVHFSAAEISAHLSKRVSTQDLAQGIAASIAGKTQVQVSVLGMTVSGSPLSSTVGALLGNIAPLLDEILNSITATLGVRLGSADVRVHQMRCGMAAVVA